MHRREDKARQGQKTFGLIGGRFNLDDLPLNHQLRPKILREVSEIDSDVVKANITSTLKRELKEEIDLVAGVHYSYEEDVSVLPVYKEVNGPSNRHAFSAYKFYLYEIKLTHIGETHLLSQISNRSDNLKWFSIDEMISPQRFDGNSAYVDVLHQAWGKELDKKLRSIPDSSASSLTFAGESKMLDLMGDSAAVFQFGKPGKEKPISPSRALSEAEWQILILLGWHARGFEILLADNSELKLLEGGWIDAANLIPTIRSLQDKIQPSLRGLVEVRENRFAALRIAPDILFFSASLFQYQFRGSNAGGGEVRIKRLDVLTPWAKLYGEVYERDIKGSTLSILRELEKGDEPSSEWDRALRDQLGDGLRSIGLRRLWSMKGNTTCLIEGLKPIPGTDGYR